MQVRHGEYQGTKETVNISTHSLCFEFFPQNFHTINRHLDQPSKLWWKCAVQKRPGRDKSPEAMKIRNRLSGSSTWCIAMFCGEGCGPRETAQITGTSLSHPILQVFHWMLPDSYKWGCLPELPLIKKHKYTNLSPSLLVYGPRTPPQNISLA